MQPSYLNGANDNVVSTLSDSMETPTPRLQTLSSVTRLQPCLEPSRG